jgi:predicted nucleotidyltransferase
MDLTRPYSAVVPSIDGDVLVVLAGTTRPLTGRQVAGLSRRGSARTVAIALDRLVRQGLVHRHQAGRAYLHTFNEEHLAAPIVRSLAGLRGALISALETYLSDFGEAVVHASMFGSAARGDGDVDSDIDLLIVSPEGIDDDHPWRGPLDGLSEAVLGWTGNHAAIVELSMPELADLVRRGAPILDDLMDDAITLHGRSLAALLREVNT